MQYKVAVTCLQEPDSLAGQIHRAFSTPQPKLSTHCTISPFPWMARRLHQYKHSLADLAWNEIGHFGHGRPERNNMLCPKYEYMLWIQKHLISYCHYVHQLSWLYSFFCSQLKICR